MFIIHLCLIVYNEKIGPKRQYQIVRHRPVRVCDDDDDDGELVCLGFLIHNDGYFQWGIFGETLREDTPAVGRAQAPFLTTGACSGYSKTKAQLVIASTTSR